ncbi:hypothetical protein BC938DRAFT_472653 [Jimgerdemannia flammicorona]|uniref:Alpha-ketoglutarate-dependent dioxygenase AlkB-like domain-containing protein n=1 Tax=Jimgerdemannia flammicorona TaxID=994334 RepID=A0A433QTT6_9FUNG|nr:hypothetical protein BC938DRAFT_472653 [Jimgerdemannia flammicorona]
MIIPIIPSFEDNPDSKAPPPYIAKSYTDLLEQSIDFRSLMMTENDPDQRIPTSLHSFNMLPDQDQAQYHPATNLTTNLTIESPPCDVFQPRHRGPQVWSETRQELCEGTTYFRSYHGGVYHKNGVVFGFLIDGWGSMRDEFTGRTFISHGGGRSASSSSAALKRQKVAKYRLSSSQNSSDLSISALLNSYHEKKPVVVIVGSRYKKTTFEIPHRYCVLGWYGITHAWAEIEEQEIDNDGDLTDEDLLINGDTRDAKRPKRESMESTTSRPGLGTLEPRGGFVRWKFRFEWIENQEFAPWWESDTQPIETTSQRSCPLFNPINLDAVNVETANESRSQNFSLNRRTLQGSFSVNVENRTISVHRRSIFQLKCEACGRRYPIIYKEGWLCLNATCQRFWKCLTVGSTTCDDPPKDLTISEDFLAPGLLAPEFDQWAMPFSIIPPLPPDTTKVTHDLGRLFWKGSHCERCGRISCREQWRGWQCQNCRALHNTAHPIIPAAVLRNPNSPLYDGPVLDEGPVHISTTSGIVKAREILPGGVVKVVYLFPKGGLIFHFISPQSLKREADELFELYQTQEESPERDIVGFRRHPLAHSKVRSRLLANQFSYNAGAPYKHAVRVETAPLDQAPFAVRRALQIVHNTSRLINPEYEFNEVLSIAYMEGQRMSWHNDGEKDVGEIIASLSMGSDAELWFRHKRGPHTPPNVSPLQRPRGRPRKGANIDVAVSQVPDPPVQVAKALDGSEASAPSNETLASSSASTAAPFPAPGQTPFGISVTIKRPRGRPRKLPAPAPASLLESTKLMTCSPIATPVTVNRQKRIPKRKHTKLNSQDSDDSVSIAQRGEATVASESTVSRTVLKLRLSHGDILIMRGREIQKYYEHAAYPTGFRIVATARRIITNT